MPNIRVLLADDHPIVLSGIHTLLDGAMGIEVIGETRSGAEALRMVEELKPDILLLDMELPDIKGVEVAQQLNAKEDPVRILALSSYDDLEYISEVLAHGAAGYLMKDEVPDTIVEAVRGVARGESGWVSRKVASKISRMLQDDNHPRRELTNREREVLSFVVEGKTNAEIGYLLNISEKTVEKHLEGIFSKLQVSSRVEAAVMAVRENLTGEQKST